MNKKNLYVIWAVLFALCAVFGFVSAPAGLVKALMVMMSVGFFLPPALLIWKGARRDAQLVRNLAAASLGLTAVMLVLNFLSVQASRILGDVVYAMLVIISAPMICSQYWAVSLFCWAFLMIWAMKTLKKQRK